MLSMKKWILLSILILISIGFIQNINADIYPTDKNSAVEFSSIIDNTTNSCNKENLTLLYRLSCAEEVKGPHLRILLTSLITNQERFTKELIETKRQLEETKKEIRELKESINHLNNSQISSSTSPLTGMTISDNEDIEIENKGIVGFFKRIFYLNK